MLQQYLCQYICRSDWQGRCILLKHNLWSKSLCAQTMEEPVLKQHKQFCCFASALYYPDFHRLCLIDSNEFTTYSCFCKSSCSFLTSMLMYVLQLCQLYVLFSSINTKQRNILPFFLVYYDWDGNQAFSVPAFLFKHLQAVLALPGTWLVLLSLSQLRQMINNSFQVCAR